MYQQKKLMIVQLQLFVQTAAYLGINFWVGKAWVISLLGRLVPIPSPSSDHPHYQNSIFIFFLFNFQDFGLLTSIIFLRGTDGRPLSLFPLDKWLYA